MGPSVGLRGCGRPCSQGVDPQTLQLLATVHDIPTTSCKKVSCYSFHIISKIFGGFRVYKYHLILFFVVEHEKFSSKNLFLKRSFIQTVDLL